MWQACFLTARAPSIHVSFRPRLPRRDACGPFIDPANFRLATVPPSPDPGWPGGDPTIERDQGNPAGITISLNPACPGLVRSATYVLTILNTGDVFRIDLGD